MKAGKICRKQNWIRVEHIGYKEIFLYFYLSFILDTLVLFTSFSM